MLKKKRKLSDGVSILLINVKMPTNVGILTFMSRIYFMLSWVEHEKSFITPGSDVSVRKYGWTIFFPQTANTILQSV